MDPWKERRAPSGVQRKDDHREDYERDRARVIHSSAFRRLQAKTQILGVLDGDFHRTRLTHSMEVAQIGRGLVLNFVKRYPELKDLLPRLEQIETTGLAHDLGHPPFGHGGESALNYAMANYGGFEGNGQTLRILTKLESHTPEHGLDLTRRTLLGVLKYPVPYSRLYRKTLPVADLTYEKLNFQQTWQPPKCYLDTEQDVLNWILFPLSASDKKNFC
ncbi:MAG: dGTPase, partial [SAR324 cluster bacterium]